MKCSWQHCALFLFLTQIAVKRLGHHRAAGTIHQPSIDIFEAFDDLLLMKSGGYITYHGPLGKRSRKLVDYFQVRGMPTYAAFALCLLGVLGALACSCLCCKRVQSLFCVVAQRA